MKAHLQAKFIPYTLKTRIVKQVHTNDYQRITTAPSCTHPHSNLDARNASLSSSASRHSQKYQGAVSRLRQACTHWARSFLNCMYSAICLGVTGTGLAKGLARPAARPRGRGLGLGAHSRGVRAARRRERPEQAIGVIVRSRGDARDARWRHSKGSDSGRRAGLRQCDCAGRP